MIINKTQENEKLIFNLEGRLDTTTAPLLQQTLIPAFDNAKEVTLDFKKLAYISSAGLRILLLGQKKAKAKNASMSLCNVSAEIMEIFDITGFSNILTVF